MAWIVIKQEGKWFAQDEDTGELQPKKGLPSKSEALKLIKNLMTGSDMAKSEPKAPMGPENMPEMPGTMPMMPEMTRNPPAGPASGPDMAGLADILRKKVG